MSIKALFTPTVFAIALLMLSFGVEAKAQSATISLPANTSVTPGQDDVSIPITLSNNTGQIVGYVIEVQYNPQVIVPNEPARINTTGTLTTPFDSNTNLGCIPVTGITMNSATLNTLRIAVSCNPAITAASGTLLFIRFDVVGAGGTSTPLTFNVTANNATSPTYFEYESGTPNQPTRVAPTGVNGTVTVTGVTAASVNLAGQVLMANGRGLKNAQVRLTTADGTTRTVMSSAFGYYRFADVQAGQTVTIEILSKRYGFQPQIVNVSGDVSNLNFIAEP
jgi:hypothetical protein